jgi:hypothetical protein
MVYPYEEKSEHGIPWHTTFIGKLMQHNYWLYAVVDKVMVANPQIRSIIEIGTGNGALTTVFGLWGIKRNIPVLTIDHQLLYDKDILSKLGVEVLQTDEFLDSTKEKILSVINNEPTWVYCDGGFKTKEFLTYAPLIPVNSIISAHDLGVEFSDKLALQQLGPNIVEPYQKELWTELNIQLALFRRI